MDTLEMIEASFRKSFPDARVVAFNSDDYMKSSYVTCEFGNRAVTLRIVGTSGYGVRDLKLDLREEIFGSFGSALLRAAQILRS